MIFVISWVGSLSITIFLALLFWEMRNISKEELGLDYAPSRDYAYLYGWVTISAIISAFLTMEIGA